MAIGKASDFVIYDELFNNAYVEKQTQNIEALMGASNGTITISGEQLKGDYQKKSFFKKISSFVTRRDTTSTSTATDLAVTQGEMVGVKMHRKIGPLGHTLSALNAIASSPEEFSFVFGYQAADDVMADKLNVSLGGVVGALYHQGTSSTADYGTATCTHAHLAAALAKFGDQASRIKAWYMHSKVYYDLVGQSIADKITNVADVTIVNGTAATLGRPVIVTDSSSLINTVATPDQYITLGLQEGAIQITDSEVPRVESQIVTGLENLVIRIQGEYAWNLALLGFTWDTSTGGANPTAAAVAIGNNWDPVATSHKDMCGVRLINI